MTTQKDIEFVYDDMDALWRCSLGDHADITGAFYNGDYSKSLQQAQDDKHTWVLDGIRFQPGHRILDIGCGWGPMLEAIHARQGIAVGLTLSPKQRDVCCRRGLDARLMDWKAASPGELGLFDGVVSIGSFEAYCSVEEYLAGRRDEIYRAFMAFCHDVLKDGGKLFLQTMTWGRHIPWANRDPSRQEVERFSNLRAPRKSDERVLANVRAFFPGSWVPRNLEHLVEVAEPYFEYQASSDGRLDYIQTLTEWEKAWNAAGPGKRRLRIQLTMKHFLRGRQSRAKLQCYWENSIRELFIRDLFGHQRVFFKKRPCREARSPHG
jgi:cyclopropane-fatty-acyl-phospholipid synthase